MENGSPMISDRVVIMTRDEFDDRLEKEFRRGADAALDAHIGDRAVLFERAALSDHDTEVIYSTDGLARVHIFQSVDSDLGDCLTLRWHSEVNNPNHHWYYAHFSPARARLIACELIRRATLLEELGGTKPIDPIPERFRKGPIQ